MEGINPIAGIEGPTILVAPLAPPIKEKGSVLLTVRPAPLIADMVHRAAIQGGEREPQSYLQDHPCQEQGKSGLSRK